MAEEIQLEDGKYTVVFDQGHLAAKRHGEPWRDLSGDHLVYAMFCEIQRLERKCSGQPDCDSPPAPVETAANDQGDGYVINQLDRGIHRLSELVMQAERHNELDGSENLALSSGRPDRYQTRRANLLELQWHLRNLRKTLSGADPCEGTPL